MKYRALKPLIYSGVSYETGAEVNILEKSVVKSCLERGLIAEINGKTEMSEELVETENTEETDKKDTKK